jgi:two-component system response regulator YesN
VKRFVTNLGVLQIFLSLLLVISVMAVSTYYVYRSSISGIYEKISDNNALVAKSIVQSFDSSFRTINNLIASINTMPPYNYSSSENDGQIDMTKVYTLVGNLSALVSTMDYVEEVVVFFDEGNMAITSKGTSSFQLQFDNKYKHEMYTSNYWLTFAKTKHSLKVFPVDNYQIFSSQVSRQYMSKKLMVVVSDTKYKLSNKNVMILMDVESLFSQLSQVSLIPGSSLIVLDQNKNVILSTDTNMDLVEVLNDVYFNTPQAAEGSITRENYEYNFYKSEYNDFIYIAKVPYQFQNLDSVTTGNRLIILMGIICAILISVFLSIYIYRPIKVILRLFGSEAVKGNDFRKIHSGVVKLQIDNESYLKQLSFADAELRRGVFLQVLDEYTHTKEHDIQLQKYYPDFFRARHFLLALLQMNEKGIVKGYSLPVELLAERVQSCLKREKIDAHVFHYANDQFLVVIGLDQPIERDRLMNRMAAIIARAEKEDFIGFSLWACISKGYTSQIENCKRAFRDVENGFLYRNVNTALKVMDAERINFVWNIYFPFENMEKISNYVMDGKVAEGIQIIKETLKENIERNVHHHQITHVAKSMYFYLLRNRGGSSHTLHELYELESEFCRKIDHVQDYQEIENAIIEVVEYVAKHSKQSVKGKLDPTFISQYIELHYMENMYLDHIAEVMETSSKYFSNYFKKTFGVNYVEYLNKVRLSHARELLKETSLSIAEIGEKTGYLNSSTFTTTFRKYLGISPSEYRKQNVS